MKNPKIEGLKIPERVSLKQMTAALGKAVDGYGYGDLEWTLEDEEAAFVAANTRLYVEIEGEWRADPKGAPIESP